MMHRALACAALAMFACQLVVPAASAQERPSMKPAIVLAAFGTTDVEAVDSILNIEKRVKAAFPDYDVRLAFTSNIIRGIWHKRANDADFKKENPGVSEEIYAIKNPLTVLANIQEEGARPVLVQSLHVTDGDEYKDLAELVKTLASYKTQKRSHFAPFAWIAVGNPALGVGDGQPKYLDRAVEALAPLARKAWESESALVLMGHGNEHLTQEVFAKLEDALRKKYGPQVYIGTVEAPPFAEDIVESIGKSEKPPRSVLLAPLMVVAGDHARNDMAGDEEDSWASIFKANGFAVDTHLIGLGSNDSWADIYVEHLKVIEPAVKEKQAKDKAEKAKEKEEGE